MATLHRSEFKAEMAGKTLDRAVAAADPRLAGLDLAKADLDGDGQIRGSTEMSRLFTELDRFDLNGSSHSVDAASASVAPRLAALRAHAVAPAPPVAPGVPGDPALEAAFPLGIAPGVSFASGAGKTRLRAVQYTLGRLDLYAGRADGLWGPRTLGAIQAFQTGAGLPPTGRIDAATLGALDAAILGKDLRVPAVRAADPLAYLSDFAALPLSPIAIADETRPIGWSHPEIRAAYGRFVGEYWEVMKENRVEADCKTVALFFMDQFRKKLAHDTGIELPRSRSPRGSIPNATWRAVTAQKPMDFFSRTDALPVVRPGYAVATALEKLDPAHSMIYGVNVRYAGITANGVSRAATPVAPWDPSRDNRGDRTKAEIPLELVEPGDLVFLDHSGDGTYDHTVNVVRVERDASGRLEKLVLAVGSFDDMKDADSSTPPTSLATVNNYSEEVTVRFSATGRITGSEVTWQSEPAYVSAPRYRAENTLMELGPGGTIFLARWS